MVSGSSLSSGTTSSTKRGTVGGAGAGERGVMATFLAFEKNLMCTEDNLKGALDNFTHCYIKLRSFLKN